MILCSVKKTVTQLYQYAEHNNISQQYFIILAKRKNGRIIGSDTFL